MLVITEYWSKVVDDKSAPFGRKVLKDEYEIKSQHMVDNTLAEIKKRMKGNPRATIGKDFIREEGGNAYGVHSYTIIRETELRKDPGGTQVTLINGREHQFPLPQ